MHKLRAAGRGIEGEDEEYPRIADDRIEVYKSSSLPSTFSSFGRLTRIKNARSLRTLLVIVISTHLKTHLGTAPPVM